MGFLTLNRKALKPMDTDLFACISLSGDSNYSEHSYSFLLQNSAIKAHIAVTPMGCHSNKQ